MPKLPVLVEGNGAVHCREILSDGCAGRPGSGTSHTLTLEPQRSRRSLAGRSFGHAALWSLGTAAREPKDRGSEVRCRWELRSEVSRCATTAYRDHPGGLSSVVARRSEEACRLTRGSMYPGSVVRNRSSRECGSDFRGRGRAPRWVFDRFKPGAAHVRMTADLR